MKSTFLLLPGKTIEKCLFAFNYSKMLELIIGLF